MRGVEIPYNIDDLKMYDQSNGWATVTVPEFAVLNTEGGAEGWKDVTPETTNGLFISVNKDTAFIVSTTGEVKQIYRTTNRGVTWETTTIHSESDGMYYVHFINENTGWITGQVRSEGYNNRIEILTTEDGGKGWSKVKVDDQMEEGYKNGAVFTSPSHGLITATLPGEPLLYTTSNGGEMWTKKKLVVTDKLLPDLFSEPQNPTFYNENEGILPIVFHSGEEIFIEYMLTTDSGSNWSVLSNNQKIDVPKEDQNLHFDSVDANHIWQTTDGVNLYIVSAAPENNEIISVPEALNLENAHILDFSFVSKKEGFMVVKSNEKVYWYVTHDGGKVWQ
ncbi:WD40/YVTN/BNR-like repeat-containing protein [Paenibacillus luteus]|uniref:WD40/YVTN/BNR-like repeat-containing protein n=1 Tax=Paenibacillus luteus TaxID=2545753 RepID=UPI001375E60D|nr:YCF48-related protein [Paenibacillus luteus]